jgi:hypothetical protein
VKVARSAQRLGVAILVGCCAASHDARACAPAPRPGAEVSIADESAIVVWDKDAKREHFIRRASFRSDAKDFGFLVPTPDIPELSAVDDAIFTRLEQVTSPEEIHQARYTLLPTGLLLGFFLLSRGAPGSSSSVRVLDEQRVAGYDAVVLGADSPDALAGWLASHGYAARPALEQWLRPYVAQKWKLTAFRIASDAGAGTISTQAVRMSFHTDRPFFPYREPSDQRDPTPTPLRRSLRIFYVASERASAVIGVADHWPGRTLWSDRLDPARAQLPVDTTPGAWLTAFEDDASPRPGTDDLYFSPANDRAAFRPPPIVIDDEVRIPIPIDLLLIALAVGYFLLRRSRLRRGDQRHD